MKKTILRAAAYLKNGQVVAFPTETVYGLGASIFQENGLKSIFSLKGRPQDNPLIVHIHDLNQVFMLARDIPPEFFTLAKAFFPGPLTLILPKSPELSNLVTASLDTIAIRMPDHKIALSLLKELDEPIAAPSANLSGKPSPTSYQHVEKYFSDNLPLILDGGECAVGIESTVLSLVGEPTILRPGSITQKQIEDALVRAVKIEKAECKALCPGMKYRHYAPKARVLLFRKLEDIRVLDENTMVLSNHPIAGCNSIYPFSQKSLYKLFHLADEKGIDSIQIYLDKESERDIGLMNRIEKSSQ
jgi:L-threonylcarbamoyladenylate synthase